MARIALGLPVFISSPADVQEERDRVEQAVMALAPRAAREDLLLSVYRFEKSAIPAYGRPLDQSNVDLRASELVIAILGKGIGSPARKGFMETGTLEEIRIAERLVKCGHADDLFLYYRALDDKQPVPSVAATVAAIMESRKQTVWPYRDPDDLVALVARHVERWLEDWYGIPKICRHAFESSDVLRGIQGGENRLNSLFAAFDIDGRSIPKRLGELAVRMYQRHGPSAATLPLPPDAADLTPFVSALPDSGVRFAHAELFYLACASGLLDAIVRGDPAAMERKEYVNQVHQYLATLIDRTADIATVTSVLCDWLARRSGSKAVRPTARNFAAYVLGMINAHGAADQLAESLVEDSGAGVRMYCITSLGKLRSRRHLPLLRSAYNDREYSQEQDMIAKAICRIIGVAGFAL
ncbi:MAG TPA: hypothetical protein VIX73_17860 [Kofleriaceae bacterium]|jgi:hypothetical protein